MKKNVKKKIIVGIITMFLVLIYFTITNTSNAEDIIVTWDISEDDGQSHVTATLYSDGNMIISGTGKIKGDTSFGKKRPYNDNIDDIKTITIEEGITAIGYSAFINCINLTNIEIPNSITSIGEYAFEKCKKLENIRIPEGITRIEDTTFQRCSNLISIEIPNSVKSIGSCAFTYCSSLTSINLPEGVTSIEYAAFSHCKNLTSINLPEGITNINAIFSGCSSLTSIDIPEGVTNIGESAFYDCSSLTSINLPEGVTSIGESAFARCTSLTDVVIGNSVTSIGDSAFLGCKSLSKIEIPKGVITIGRDAFYGCTSLTQINIPKGVTNISKGVFDGCSSLTSIDIPEEVTSIGNYAFETCTSLAEIEIPDSVTSIGERAFYGCTSLTKIEIPNNVLSIENNAFSNCKSLTEVKIGDSVASIGEWAFAHCENLTNINIPEGVTSIGNTAFYNCTSLTEIVIPDSVTSIGEWAFNYCTSLTKINIPDSVTSIEDDTFGDCKSLTELVIGNSVTSIGKNSFSSCTSLTEIEIPDSVTSIGEWAFNYCTSLTKINIPDSVTSIEDDTFGYCKSLTELVIGNSVTSIGKSAFYYCTSLKRIDIPDSVTSIGDEAFSECENLIIYTNSKYVETYAREHEIRYVVDNRAPIISEEINPKEWTNEYVTITITITDNESGVKEVLFDNKVVSLENGRVIITVNENKSYSIEAKDKLGNTSEKIIVVDKIDKEKPIIERVEGNSSIWTKENVTLKVIAEDTLSGIKDYSFDGGTTWQTSNEKTYTENTQNIVIKVRDNVGNVTENESISITKIDKKLPVIEKVEGNSNTWTKGNVTLKVTAKDLLSEIKDYSFDGGVTWQESNEKTYTENTENIVIKVRDNAGNIVEHEPISITKIDKNKPTIRVDGNPNIWTNSDKKITITITDEESGIKKVKVNNNEVKINNGKIDILANENKTFEIIATDEAGNETKQTLVIDKIDKEKPTIEKVEGNPNNWTNGNVTLKVTAKDLLSGIKDYSFDGGTTWQTSNEKTYTENTENIVIKVRDNVENVTEYGPISITKIRKLEDIEIRQQPEKAEYVEGENFNIAGMKVVAIYDNGTEEEITRYTIVNGNNLREGQGSVTVRYKEGDVTKEVIQKIAVEKRLAPDVGNYEIIEDNGVKYIEKIKEGTSIKELKEKIKTNGTIEIYKGSNKVTGEDELIGTGMTIKVKLNNQEAIYEAVVTGDLTGDGKIKMADLLKLARYKAGIDKNLSGGYLKAGDVVKNGKIGMPDILKLSRLLAGIEKIK